MEKLNLMYLLQMKRKIKYVKEDVVVNARPNIIHSVYMNKFF